MIRGCFFGIGEVEKKMSLRRFLSLLAACIGLFGAIFLAKGLIVLNPRAILHLTSPYARIAYAPEQISSMAGQKADALIGVIYISLAFLIQVCSLIFVDDKTNFIKTKWLGFWIVIAIVSVLTVIFSFINIRVSSHIRLETGKVAVKDYLAKRLNRMVNLSDVKTLEKVSEDLLDINKRNDETRVDFIKRIAEYVGWTIIKETDFSKITDE